MNFYGHAFVAAERSRDPAFLFGSMLPDFCTMAGLRLEATAHPRIEAGVAHHHETDEVFHAAPTFVELMGWGRDELEAADVRLGPAMAVGHVGVELLLDGWLWRDAAPVPYREALELGRNADLRQVLRFRGDASGEGSVRMRSLLSRLLEFRVPKTQDDPEQVADRLRRILAPRPRLAMNDAEHRAVRRWLGVAREEVEVRAPTLLEEVRSALSDRPST